MPEQSLSELSFDDLKKHNSKNDCWIAVHSKIYDVTDFLDAHPGGSSSAFMISGRPSDTDIGQSYSSMLERMQLLRTMRSTLLAFSRSRYP